MPVIKEGPEALRVVLLGLAEQGVTCPLATTMYTYIYIYIYVYIYMCVCVYMEEGGRMARLTFKMGMGGKLE